MRTPANLSESVHRRLNMYALAASAAGVSLLALAQPAEGKIVYTKTHRVMYKLKDFVNLDLNQDGIVDFVLEIMHSEYPRVGAELVAYPGGYLTTANTVRGSMQRGRRFAAAYPVHYEGSPPKPANLGALMEHGCAASSTSACRNSGTFGNWLNAENRYLGLAFVVNGKTHYGWARLSAGITRSGGRLRAVLTGYACETIPGKAIITGKTKGPDDAGGVDNWIRHL